MMVSRRKILSRSRDDLTGTLDLDNQFGNVAQHSHEDDCWYSKEKLSRDHVEEIIRKWDSIDDEIWAKAIVMERNRRVAKAYARAPVLTINGGIGGFDGFRLGMNGFANPMRDPKTEEFKANIGLGAKVKMDEQGNVLIKRLSKTNVYVKNSPEDSAVSNDIMKMPNGAIDIEKPFKIFDMRKFQQNINRELRRTNPDRTRLEAQCVTPISFVKNEPELLDSPIWVLIINIVALEMLKAKFPPGSRVPFHQMQTMSLEHPKRRLPMSGSSDEDPYSLTASGSSGSSAKLKNGSKTPLVPKKERDMYGPKNWPNIAERNWSATQDRKRDRSRDNFLEEEQEVSSTLKPRTNYRRRIIKKTEDNKKTDDPYYCGFTARIPTFAQNGIQTAAAAPLENQNTKKRPSKEGKGPKYREPGVLGQPGPKGGLQPGSKGGLPGPKGGLQPGPKGGLGQNAQSAPNLSSLAHIPAVTPFWWHSRIHPDTSTQPRSKGQPSYQTNFQDVSHMRNYSPNEFSSFQFPPRAVPHTPMTNRHANRHALPNSRQSLFRPAWD